MPDLNPSLLQRRTINQKIAVLVLIPVILSIGFAGFVIWDMNNDRKIAKTMEVNVAFLAAASDFITCLQKERGKSNLYIDGVLSQGELDNLRQQTDRAGKKFQQAITSCSVKNEHKNEATEILARLGKLREAVNRKVPVSESFADYTSLVNRILHFQSCAINSKTTKGIGKKMANSVLFEEAKESAAKLRGLMGAVLAANKPLAPEVFNQLVEYQARIKANLESPALAISKDTREQIAAYQKSPIWQEANNIFQKVIRNADIGKFNVDPKEYFQMATQPVDDINNLVIKELDNIGKTTSQIASEAATRIWMSIVILSVFIVVLLAISFMIGRSISRPISTTAKSLADASAQVGSISKQVSDTSQQLAEGSSQQAAALQETSSSLEEMASMTKTNAEHANEANILMNETGAVVEQANKSMDDLNQAMQEISAASDETVKIVKTIDEIAFQTNLLALNAAVEAARAGDAGAGFAVVADEVRNLALRAADAAKRTATLIEGTVTKVKDGSSYADKAEEAFTQVYASITKAKELVAEITAASGEQSQGVDEISKAVNEMSRVTQAVAASAQESAGASVELTVQSRDMRTVVDHLVSMVGGGNGARKSSPGPALLAGVSAGPNHSSGNGRAKMPPRLQPKPAAPHPEKVIPLEEREFDDF